MTQLRAMPIGLPACKQYISFRMVPRPAPREGFDKVPIGPDGANINAHDTRIWNTAAAVWSSPFNTHGIGWVVTPGWLVIDLDHCLTASGWSPLAVELCQAFPGAYVDVTPSGTGLRIICRGTLPDGHRCRFEGGEVYSLARFVTITGNGARGDGNWEASPELCSWLVERLKLQPEVLPALVDEGRDPLWQGPEDDDTLIAQMVGQQSRQAAVLFDGKATMAQKWNMDEAALARSWGVEGRSDGLPFDHSSVDMAVMSDLNYWTGRDLERMERLFRRWPGFRDWKYGGKRRYHMDRVLRRGMNGKEVLGERKSLVVGTAATVDVPAQPGEYLAYLPDHTYYHRPTGQFYPAASVDDVIAPIAYAKDPHHEANGDKTMKATKWLARNHWVNQKTWFPGMPEIIENCVYADGVLVEVKGQRVLNTYKAPLPPQPRNDDVSGWLMLLRFVYPEHAETILDWMAHAAQFPQIKINWCIVLGGSQGIGKDSILAPLMRAVGERNWRETTPEVILTSAFNPYLQSRVLRINEAKDTGGESRFQFYDKTKTIITAPPTAHVINDKREKWLQIPNLNAVIITTNYRSGGLYLPADDRRHYVTFSSVIRTAFPEGYWEKYWAWMNGGAIEACAAFLMSRDISHFNPKAPPLQTPEFWEMVEGGQHGETNAVGDLVDGVHAFVLSTLAGRAMSAEIPDRIMHDWLIDGRNGTKIQRALEDAGYVRVPNPDDKRGRWLIKGKREKIYAMQKFDKQVQLSLAKGLLVGR